MKNKPRIRFIGFTEDWEPYKLEDICLYQSSSVTINDVDENGRYDLYDANSLIGKTNKGFMEKEYITIIKDGAGVGRTRILPKNSMFLGTMGALTPQNSNLGFLYQLVTSANLGKICSGSTIPHIYFKDYGKLKFYIPSIIEQEVIGKFFYTIDNLITLHQRKLEKLKLTKKALLQKLFPKNGSQFPEVRFKGFTDAWEQCKLENLGTLKNGMNFSKEAMGKGYPFINLQNIFGSNVIDITKLEKAEATDSQLKDYNLQKGDVLFVRSSVKLEGVGEAALISEDLKDTTYSGFIIRFRDNYGLDYNFKRFIFTTVLIRNQIMSQATNSANKNISQSVLMNLNLFIPTKDEQSKIGFIFSELDKCITLHQRKLDKLQEVKKGLLQKMFV